MREPLISYSDDEMTAMPYSVAPADLLKDVIARGSLPGTGANMDHFDRDFRRRYAVILLQERGL